MKKIGYYYIQNNQSISRNSRKNYDDTIKFIFLHLKFIFENTKNNKYEKDIINCLFDRLYFEMLGKSFYLIKKNFFFYEDIKVKFIIISKENLFLSQIIINKEIKLSKFKLIE